MTSKMLINVTELNNIELIINQQYYELMIHNYWFSMFLIFKQLNPYV